MSILQRIERLERAANMTDITPVTPTDGAAALLAVKNRINQSQEGQVAQSLNTYTSSFLDSCPKFDPENLSSIIDIIEYSVSYVETIYPGLSRLLKIAAEDSSPFKLQTCIVFICLIVPPAFRLAEDIVTGIINSIVALKNKIEEAVQPVAPMTVVTLPKKKKKWFSCMS